jgi:hypothetical protein
LDRKESQRLSTCEGGCTVISRARLAPSTVFLEIDYRWRQKYAGMPPAMAKPLTLTTPTIDLILGDRFGRCMDGDGVVLDVSSKEDGSSSRSQPEISIMRKGQ